MDRREIAKKLLEAYEESGKSYTDLSKLTGIPRSMIQRYLSGNIDRIPIERLQALCRVFGLDINELLGWSDPSVDGKINRSVTPQQNILLEAADNLTDYERQVVMNMIEALKAGRKN